MSGVRRPVAAGTFYPGSRAGLVEEVDGLLAVAEAAPNGWAVDSTALRGLIVPHAGYAYSGPVAATAYAQLRHLAATPSLAVVLGPSHFEPLRGLSVAPHDAWSTPLGEVALDDAVRQRLISAGAACDAVYHRAEHSIEVQLPFLQRCLPGVPVLPLAVGSGRPGVGAETLAGAMPPDALLIVSTDLSHYHDAETARRLDARTAEAVTRLDLEALRYDAACGVDALRVAIAWAQLQQCTIALLDLRNSADTAGDPWRVVGYGAFAISGASRSPGAGPGSGAGG